MKSQCKEFFFIFSRKFQLNHTEFCREKETEKKIRMEDRLN